MTDYYLSNLQRQRPEAWVSRPLFTFIEDCWNNSLATVGNKNIAASRLADIDAIFDDFHKALNQKNASQIVPAFLFLRCFSAFRGAVMVGLCLPTDSYALLRSCLENAGYARLICDNNDLAASWLKRDEDETSQRLIRRTFTQAAIRDSIATKDRNLSETYQALYERSIDFGAHPNEKTVTLGIVPESIRTKTIQFKLLPGEGLALDHSFRTAAQVGVCGLKIFQSIFDSQFDDQGLSVRIDRVAQGL
jgi:hypothetical protein